MKLHMTFSYIGPNFGASPEGADQPMATELRVVIDPQVEAKRADVDSSNSWDDSPHHLLTQTDRFGVQSPATARTPPPTSPARGAGPQHPRSPRGAGASKSGFGPSASSASPPAAAPTLAERFFCCFCALEASPATGAAAAPTPPGSGSDAVASEGLLGPMSEADEGKICLVLDLDETLVHSSFRPIPNPDFVLPVEIDGAFCVYCIFAGIVPAVPLFVVCFTCCCCCCCCCCIVEGGGGACCKELATTRASCERDDLRSRPLTHTPHARTPPPYFRRHCTPRLRSEAPWGRHVPRAVRRDL